MYKKYILRLKNAVKKNINIQIRYILYAACHR